MDIYGLQKVTLLDYPGKVACTVFTVGCNFRCPFCHNKSLVTEIAEDASILEADFFSYLEKRKAVLDGVCITGGEPLLQTDIEDFLVKIKEKGYLVKLDTNGSFASSLKNLVSKGLVDYVAMDVKNSIERYPQTVGLDICNTKDIEKSVDFLLSGSIPYEFRTTVVGEFHDKESFIKIAQWIENPEKYFLQGFIDSENVIKRGLSAYSLEELEGFAEILREKMSFVEIRGL
ncbi:MAG: anaerobic ribonucleoside-triphosphate reductase activating protein [Anaerovoracaceae bacterium]|jgi:pyruvate formate lyase activating enzyme|nr:anaerobic ribonucleoside-triphosphate reductase activating protein [Anaerovoracaceae bacterium]